MLVAPPMRYAVCMAFSRPFSLPALAFHFCLAFACAPALAAPETYVVTPGRGQSARFDASTQTEHYGGHTDQVSGTVTFDGKAPAQTTAWFDVALSSLSTGNSLRDSRMRRAALQTDRFPTAKFRLSRIVMPAAPTLAGRTVRVSAQGLLTLHGVTRPVATSIDVTREIGPMEQPGLHIAAHFVVRLEDYHIAAPRFLFFAVRQEHTLSVDLHALPAPRRERLPSAPRNKP